MDLRQLVAYKEVAKHGSFTRAATNLYLTQSAVSQQIKALEDELGMALFYRTGRLVRLTDAGQEFLPHVQRILADVEQARAEMAKIIGGDKGSCRLACLPSIAASLLPQVIVTFKKHHPAVNLHAMVGLQSQVLAWIREGTVDVGIAGMPLQDAHCTGQYLLSEEFVLVVPCGHALAQRHTVRLAEVSAESFILFPRGDVARDLFFEACQQEGFEPNVVYESDSLSAHLGMVAAGLGVSIVSRLLTGCTSFHGTVALEFMETPIVRDVGMLWHEKNNLPQTVHNLISLIDVLMQNKENVSLETTAIVH